MAEINYIPLVDGTAATAASLNDRFTELAAGANDLEGYTLSPGALNAAHLPSIANIVDTKKVGENYVTHAYDVQWVFDQDNAISDPAPHTGTSWAVIKTLVPPAELVLDFDPFVLGMDADPLTTDPPGADYRYAGVLVLLNVHFVWGGVTEYDPETTEADAVNAVTGIQIQVQGDDVWHTIRRATRICEQRLSYPFRPTATPPYADGEGTYQDMPTRVLITLADYVELGLNPASAIRGIRAVGARYRVAAPDKACVVTFREGRLTALRVRADGLPV
jgi:hypothetical protein